MHALSQNLVTWYQLVELGEEEVATMIIVRVEEELLEEEEVIVGTEPQELVSIVEPTEEVTEQSPEGVEKEREEGMINQ